MPTLSTFFDESYPAGTGSAGLARCLVLLRAADNCYLRADARAVRYGSIVIACIRPARKSPSEGVEEPSGGQHV